MSRKIQSKRRAKAARIRAERRARNELREGAAVTVAAKRLRSKPGNTLGLWTDDIEGCLLRAGTPLA